MARKGKDVTELVAEAGLPSGKTRAFKRWSSRPGLEYLGRLLKGGSKAEGLWRELAAARGWEASFISRVMWRPEYKKGTAASLRRLAGELDILRAGHVNPDHLERLDSPEKDRFYGKREHYVRLIAFHEYPEKWNQWRKGKIPDLRGANLTNLDLRYVDLSKTLLRKANLAGAVVRTGNLEGADMRACNCRHTDFSWANLNHADLRGAILLEALLSDATLIHADLREASLIATFMNRTDLSGADLRKAKVWGVSSWDIIRDSKTKEQGLQMIPDLDPTDYAIDPEFYDKRLKKYSDSSVRVDDLDVAYFVSLLLKNPKISRIIDGAANCTVLLLGRFVGKEAKVLDVLKEELPKYGYVPVVFDFEGPENRDTIETVAILAGLSSFVISNLSAPRSTPLEAHVIIPSIAVPFVPIVRESEKEFSMFEPLRRKYPWVQPTVTYRSEAQLARKLKDEIIERARVAGTQLRLAKHQPNLIRFLQRTPRKE